MFVFGQKLNSWKIVTWLVAVTLAILFIWPGTTAAQESLVQIYTQNFDDIGTDENATLPDNWRVDRDNDNVRAVGTWAAASTQTGRRSGNNMPINAANDIYNFGAGPAETATDRAIGWISSGGGTKSGNLYLHMRNDTGFTLSSIYVSYNVEKYRRGSRSEGFRIQLYHSLDGENWIHSGDQFMTYFEGDADNSGYDDAPGETVFVFDIMSLSVNDGEDFYLAWNYSVASGTGTTNAQALAIDNVAVSVIGISNLTPDATPEWLEPGWQFWARENTFFGDSVCVEVHPVGDPENYIRTQCEWDTAGGPDGSNWRCDVFTSGVPSAFHAETVEYQFFVATTEGNGAPACTNNLHSFTGFNWQFETGPTAITLTAIGATPAASWPAFLLILLLAAGITGISVLVARRRPA